MPLHPSFIGFEGAGAVKNVRQVPGGVRFQIVLRGRQRLESEVTFAEGGFVRIRFGPEDRLQPLPGVPARPLVPDTVRVSRREGVLELLGQRLRVRVRLDAWRIEVAREEDGWETLWASSFDDVDPEGTSRVLPLGVREGRLVASFAVDPTEHVYGFGEQFTRLDKYGQTVRSGSGRREASLPFYLSSKGYGVLFNTEAPLRHDVASPDLSILSYVLTAETDAVELFLLDGPDPKGVLSRLAWLRGGTPVPSLPAFGVILGGGGPEDVAAWHSRDLPAELPGAAVPIYWGSRAIGTLGAMASALRASLNAGLSGQPWWGNTVNNSTSSLSPELFVRWAQFGLLSTHVQYVNAERAPWTFGPRALEVYRRYAHLRARLLPYLHHLAHEAATSGWPLMRAMAVEFPDDLVSYALETQFMLGPDLLVAPVLTPANHVNVYLPDGEWVDYWTGRVVVGPRWLRLKELPLETMPLYLRADAAVPCAPVTTGAGELRLDRLTLDVVPKLGFMRTLHLPGGESMRLLVERAGREVLVDLDAPPGEHEMRFRGAEVASVSENVTRRGPDTVAFVVGASRHVTFSAWLE